MLNLDTHELTISLVGTYQRYMRTGLPDLSTASSTTRSRGTEGHKARGKEGQRDIGKERKKAREPEFHRAREPEGQNTRGP